MRVLNPGDQIGEWIVDSELGEGGMGAVYRCHGSLSTKLVAAVKVMKPHSLSGARERFVRELELLAEVNHPSVVRVLGGGEDKERGVLYLAMELVDGEPLADRLQRGPLEWKEACQMFEHLGEGLMHAHKLGVVHRDIKPQNIMLCADGTAKLLDFGIAVQEGATRLTQGKGIPGTVAYMAPEVFEGTQPDYRADIYALGQVLWEALTGREAYPPGHSGAADMARIMGNKLVAEPMDPGADFPGDLRELVQHCTDPKPNTRLNDLNTFVSVLQHTGDPLAEPMRYARPKSPRRRWWIWAAVAGLGVTLLAVAAGTSVLGLLGVGVLLYQTDSGSSGGGGNGSWTTTTTTTAYPMPKHEVPKGFPFEVADDAKLIWAGKNNSAGMVSYTVTYSTEQDPQSIINMYEPAFRKLDLTILNSSTETADGTTVVCTGYDLSGRSAVASAGPYVGVGGTMVSVSWVPGSSEK